MISGIGARPCSRDAGGPGYIHSMNFIVDPKSLASKSSSLVVAVNHGCRVDFLEPPSRTMDGCQDNKKRLSLLRDICHRSGIIDGWSDLQHPIL